MKKDATILFICLILVFPFTAGSANNKIQIHSVAFSDNQKIPSVHSCDGKDISPELKWNYKNGRIKTFAITCTDPDAPGGTFVHWLVYNIPSGTDMLPAAFPKDGSRTNIRQGKNDFGDTGYNGPCPPKGRPHHYIFKIYALDIGISEAGMQLPELTKKMEGHIIAQGQVTGLYQK